MSQPHTPTLPPGPGWSFLGARLWQLRQDPTGYLTTLARTYGDIVHFNLGPRQFYLLSHPDFVRQVLVDDADFVTKGQALQRMKLLLGEGLLTSEGALHAQARQALQPAFHPNALTYYPAEMHAQVAAFTADWQSGATFDMPRAMNHLTLRIVGSTLLAYDLTPRLDAISDALDTLLAFTDPLTLALSGWLLRLPTPQRRRLHAAKQTLEAVIDAVLTAQRSGEARHGHGIVGRLLAMSTIDDPQRDEQTRRDHLLTLLLAGHETTANALAWTWYLLAQHPDIEAQVHAEVDRVLGDRAHVDDEQVRALTYTRFVFKEALRLYPPAWILGRETVRSLQIGGYEIPAGSGLLMSQWVLHRDPRYYEDAAQFRPERWLTSAAKGLPKYAYFPFGGGPRRCIGAQFAWTEGVILLATLARHWRFTLSEDKPPVGVNPKVTLRPAGGLVMSRQRR